MGLPEIFKEELPPNAYYTEEHGCIHYFPQEQEYTDGSLRYGIHLAMEYTLKNEPINRAQMLCFGNNLYGKEVMYIWENYPHIQIEIMVCSPDSEVINDNDRNTLTTKIRMALNHDNTTIYASESPPTLRACVLYSDDAPVLCCMQRYTMCLTEDRRPSFKGRHSPCIITYRMGDNRLLNQYAKCCESEFMQLRNDDAYSPVWNIEKNKIERSE